MGTRKAKVEARIEALCANHRFSTAIVYWKAVKILGRYRDIRYLSVMVTKDSEQITEKTKSLIRDKFFKSYVRKECAKTGSLDYILSDMLSIEYACFLQAPFGKSCKVKIQELFEDLGGVTLEILVDNPKALVIENNPKSEEEIRYNPQALMLAKHLGTELNACPCYWPRKKGKIERPFNYIEEQFVKGNSFATMEELNRRGKKFMEDWCDEVHGTTGRIPNQHYLLEEKVMLQPLPKNRYYIKDMQTRKVSPDSLVSINSNKYSVPVKYVGKTVQFRIVYGFRIEIYDSSGSLILRKEAGDGTHLTVIDAEHYEPIAKKVPTSIPQIRRDFTKLFTNGALYLAEAAKKYDQPT